jgi:CRISPR-associated endonuclease/helicase Cas3
VTLGPPDFAAFFRELHGHAPFPWQRILLEQVASRGEWPATLDLPTGAGKTAAIDVAVFHLAIEANRGAARRAPVRIAFVVDRRLVVDDAFDRARRIERALQEPPGPVSARVAGVLSTLALDGPPLLARRLRGGISREDDWARTPSQPTVLCSTVDQVGSRLLFRGYGVSDSMKPVHAGLLGSDCLILLDEAHLAEPFRQTLEWVRRYRSRSWRESEHTAPWGVAMLTATPGAEAGARFALDQDAQDKDTENPVLRRRLRASKPARLVQLPDEAGRQRRLVDEVHEAMRSGARAIGVVSNRVARARALFQLLRQELDPDAGELLLLIGPARPVQRDQLAARLASIRTGATRSLERPLVVVATQCIEAGVDIDLDALFTEAAPLDSLRQRFGRLNRDGRDLVPQAAILAVKEEVGARATDPVYGEALREAWQTLNEAATRPGRRADPVVDFGLAHFDVPMKPSALSPRAHAPVLMPAHLDLLAQTSPIPAADPDVALHLHGPVRQPDSITVVWRADLAGDADSHVTSRLLALAPPRSQEAIELPLWAVRRWLAQAATGGARASQTEELLADIATAEPEEPEAATGRRIYRWKGLDDQSRWIPAHELRAGDTIIVPASYGGIDSYGWDPQCTETAVDLAEEAGRGHWGRRFVVRVAPGLLGPDVLPADLSSTLGALRHESWPRIRDALLALPLPEERRDLLAVLGAARAVRGGGAVEVDFEAYGANPEGEPRGVVFVARRGLVAGEEAEEGRPNATEDDASGSLAGRAQSLAEHSVEVEAKAEALARAAGLPEPVVADLRLAGYLHDQGKRDARFQRWLHHGDPLGADPGDENTVLAKSGRTLPPAARERAGLPPHWRHEALSVRLARSHERLANAADADLVLWLVGTHHGHGRPLFPHADPTENPPEVGPQSLAFDWQGMDWPTLYERVKARYGVWELARMEAVLRLADHRASEEAAARGGDS